ncbi:MAG: lytic transglycosylase [Marmoricola sp.]|nr:lytic transglycosylase [Marmoricola sp.]
MSVTDVSARIQQLQTQLSMLSSGGVGATADTSGQFSAALAAATDANAATGSTQAADATAAVAAAGAPIGSSGSGEAVVAEAKKYLGLPYVWGGTSPTKGMDCSGLVKVVYQHFGIELPRLSADQARSGTKVASMADARPGDLIAWDNSSRNSGADHIAIYAGGGKMIEAPRTGLDIRLVDVPSTPDYIRRVLPAGGATSASGVSAAGGATARVAAGPAGAVPYASLFNSAGAKYGVAPRLLAAVAKAESGFDPRAVSGAGAQGLMQLMPGTAKGLGVANSFDPAQAVDGAARMLRDLTHRFGRVDLAVAAYNAGPGAVLKYHGIPPYAETQNYVRKVMSSAGMS